MLNNGFEGFSFVGNLEKPHILDSTKVANVSSKARGRGGIVLLVILPFPQFLVLGFGYWGWQLKPYIYLGLSLWR